MLGENTTIHSTFALTPDPDEPAGTKEEKKTAVLTIGPIRAHTKLYNRAKKNRVSAYQCFNLKTKLSFRQFDLPSYFVFDL